jgi:hypothetical protein
MYQQLWGYKVEEKLYLGVREQKRLNTTALYHRGDYGSPLLQFLSPVVCLRAVIVLQQFCGQGRQRHGSELLTSCTIIQNSHVLGPITTTIYCTKIRQTMNDAV